MPDKEKHSIEDLENALDELEKQVQDIDLPEPVKEIVCLICLQTLELQDNDTISNECKEPCNLRIPVYFIKLKHRAEIVGRSKDFSLS